MHTETLEELELLLCTAEEVIDEFDLRLADRDSFEYYHITLAGQQSELFVTLVIKTKQIPPSLNSQLDLQVRLNHCTDTGKLKYGCLILSMWFTN